MPPRLVDRDQPPSTPAAMAFPRTAAGGVVIDDSARGVARSTIHFRVSPSEVTKNRTPRRSIVTHCSMCRLWLSEEASMRAFMPMGLPPRGG